MTNKRNRMKTEVFTVGMTCGTGAVAAQAQEADSTVVRIAELVIDPAQLDAYKVATKEDGGIHPCQVRRTRHLLGCGEGQA